MSTVRHNLLTQRGYTPYCGKNHCKHNWPRTTFNGSQFECVCGWKSSYAPDFIEKVKEFRRSKP